MQNKIKTGIIGGAGYTGGELIRLLINHPAVHLSFIQSKSHAGHPVASVHEDLIGEEIINFVDSPDKDVEIVFLCSGHGTSEKLLKAYNFKEKTKIVDLSQDFRMRAANNDFIYGLPELNREKIKSASKIANPGCFATCITLGLLPLASEGLLPAGINVTGITGATGAGQSLSPTSHFSWRTNNLSVYKAFEHQHLPEIVQSLTDLQLDFKGELNFIPVRGDFARGIMASMLLKSNKDEEELFSLYDNFFHDHPFSIVTKNNPSLKQVVNTNKALVFLQKNNENLLIVSMIDNLLKGASGQAVQNMNLMFGLEETSGLKLKANAF